MLRRIAENGRKTAKQAGSTGRLRLGFLDRSERRGLIASPVKDVEDVRTAACFAIINQILSRWDAFHPAGNVARRLASRGIFSQQPETLGDAIHNAVRNLETCASSPEEKNLIQVPRRRRGNAKVHYLPP